LTSPQTGKLISKNLFQKISNRIMAILELIQNQNLAKIVGSSLFFVCARDYYETEDDSIEIV
jgi:hypothetical protein